MTIQRKYQLPNCTLLLEGLSENINASQVPEVRPVMSILVSAECKLASKQILSGGRDFFESLVTAVSGYAQEFLSQVPHAEAHNKESGLVQLQKIDANRHRLIVQPEIQPEPEHGNANMTPVPTEIDLTTVQLFDLVEAVDQFFADSRTLPDLSLELSPVSKRFTRSGQQLVQQAVPATVGASSLALAAIAFFLVPVPEVRPPQPQPQSRSAQSTSLATAPAITDPSQLVALNQKLYDQLKPAWKPQPGVKDLVYRVGVAADGKIKGYVAVNDAANAQAQQTPLPSLLAKPTTTSKTAPEPLAQFRVVFANNDVQVQPWSAKK
ncbi:MAG TPA: DUF4335 domain-containing protein [Cyanobacteria bacterium UBA11049]|nr:DUF4335 domain-containing protein [Cyanobacteria bacterium UBA11049]